ncbi:MAG TPA: MarR family transcriptional regulator [Candidatus Mcinerneyibacterium sp.]|nr:MarR family transcriptional regulator [Candidatus Mcinerneyibacterium sp.]
MDTESLCLLKDIFKKIYKFESSLQKKFSLSINEILTLCTLSGKKMSSSELAEDIGVSPSRMSRIIKKLEDKEFIERSLSKKDKRKMFFNLTLKGEKHLKKLKKSDISIPDLKGCF